MGGGTIARGIGLGLLAMLLSVAVAFLWVWFYSVALAPGHDGGFYQAYAQRVAPFAGLIAGIPILFAAGLVAARGERGKRGELAALIPAATYILIDLVLIAVSGLWPAPWTLILSWLTKIGAAWAGGRLAAPRRTAQ